MVDKQAVNEAAEGGSGVEEGVSEGDDDMKPSRKHSCGGGFWGEVIRTHGIKFCGFCGHEYGRL